MKWKKLGLIFCPDNNHDWMASHAANPVAQLMNGDIFRVFFSCRDRQNRSSIGFIEIDIRNCNKILRVSEEPVLSPGEPGSFDDSGVSIGCVVRHDGKSYLYYMGWNLGVTVPWRNSIGLAISGPPDKGYRKVSRAPILDRSDIDPYSLSYPSVMKDGTVWRMWYGSNLSWGKEPQSMAHVIKYAQSRDGIVWDRKGTICINLKSPDEYAISRPCVLKDNDIYKMWYPYRGEAYRIGYAESDDGMNWTRKDEEAGIGVSDSGWDSEMIEYPFVFDHGGRRYMLYNGNGYGRTGFGLAELVE